MNYIDFNQVGGFPMTTNILGKLQENYWLLNSFGNLAGEKTIIAGCTITGTNTNDGVVFLNGQVFEFRGGVTQTKVLIKEDTETLLYQNGNSYPSIKNRYVTFGTGPGATDWADFKRGIQTKDLIAALANKADKTVVDALVALEAEKNVQADWNQTDNTQDNFIKNKPNTITVLYQGSFAVANFGNNHIVTVSFPSVGTNNYMVIGTMVSLSSNYDNDNDVIWAVREKTNSSFKLILREVDGANQNMSFEYILIPL